jgi:hypothetical protein
MGDLTAADVIEMRRYLAETADAVDQWFPAQEWVPAVLRGHGSATRT